MPAYKRGGQIGGIAISVHLKSTLIIGVSFGVIGLLRRGLQYFKVSVSFLSILNI
jgi:hypothetical protein